MQIIDAHTHIMRSADEIVELAEMEKRFGYGPFNFLSIEGIGGAANDMTSPDAIGGMQQNAIGMLIKAAIPQNYAFGGLWYRGRDIDHLRQAETLYDIGFDGMKLIEGKPDTRVAIGKPLDDPSYDAYYSFLERNHWPLLAHIADPEEFWDVRTAPAFAVTNGWTYDKPGYPAKEQLYDEVDRVLEKHPDLRLILAHFYFLSADLERAAKFLDSHPNVSFDLTSGREMYFNFSKRPVEWREFFIRYAARLIYGTDNFAGLQEEMLAPLNNMQLAFLRRGGTIDAWGETVRCIDLPEEALQLILRENFLRLCPAPRPLNLPAALRYIDDRLAKAAEYALCAFEIGQLREIAKRLRAIG